MLAKYISIDEEKKHLKGYDPANAEKFQKESAKRANKRFTKALKRFKGSEVILLSGGSAAGKTEYYSEHLRRGDRIVFDSTLSTRKGATIKIHSITKAGKLPIIHAVIPDDLPRAFLAFLGRERKFSARYFYRTHSQSRRTLLWIARHYPEVDIRIVESVVSQERLRFVPLQYTDRKQLITFLKGIQLSQKQIIATIRTI